MTPFGRVFSDQLESGAVKTLQGTTVDIALEGGVRVGPARVTTADLEARNGIIHVIDKVLLPQ